MTIEPKELEARIKDLLHDKLSKKAFNDTTQADNASEIISAGQYSTNTSECYFSAIAKLCVENMVLKNKLNNTLQTMEASTRQPAASLIAESPMETEHNKPDTFENFHLVYCIRGRRSYYKDVPRMFQGDLISDHLRGQHGLPKNLNNFLQDNQEILFSPLNIYYCACNGGPSFHGIVGYRDGKLVADSPPAQSRTGVEIFLGKRIQNIIKSIIRSHAERFKGYSAVNLPAWHPEPYRFFFNHNKNLLDLTASSDMSESDRSCVQMLCNWFETNHREDWDEAHELISRGRINPKHYSKLFGPDELYVGRISGHDSDVLQVLKSKEFPWTIHDRYMDGYFWNFNGLFCKTSYAYSTRRFPEPVVSDETEVDITSLRWYPLRFAGPGIKEKLISRGHKFWNCRTRSLVCYREPGEAPMLGQVKDMPQYKNEDVY